MKQTGITNVQKTQKLSKKYIRKHLWEGREAVGYVIKSVPFERDESNGLSIKCEFEPVVVDRTLYFTKKSGEKRYPNSVVRKVMTH